MNDELDSNLMMLGAAVSAAAVDGKWDAIRAFYEAAMPRILGAPRHEWGVSPFYIDWSRAFSPIELEMWQEIRNEGAALYPQLPVGRFFVDFGNPVAKVAVECDGAEFHIDYRRDAERQRLIESQGWTVHRISGRTINQQPEGDEDGSVRQFVRAIARRHGLSLKAILDAGGSR